MLLCALQSPCAGVRDSALRVRARVLAGPLWRPSCKGLSWWERPLICAAVFGRQREEGAGCGSASFLESE